MRKKIITPPPALSSRPPVTNPTMLAMSWDDRFIWSAECGDVEDMKECLDKGANPHYQKPESGKTALMAAISSQVPKAIEFLLPMSPIDTQDDKGLTALMWACKKHDLLTAKELITKSNVALTDKEGTTTLMHAARTRIPALVKLLKPLSNVSAVNQYHFSAADFAMDLSGGAGDKLALFLDPKNKDVKLRVEKKEEQKTAQKQQFHQTLSSEMAHEMEISVALQNVVNKAKLRRAALNELEEPSVLVGEKEPKIKSGAHPRP